MPLIDLDSILTTPRIGEILVVGPEGAAISTYVETVCPQVEKSGSELVWGNIRASSDLMLFLYGLNINSPYRNFAWDLVADKLLGIVILFDWYHEESSHEIEKLLSFILQKSTAPIVCAADTRNRPIPYRESVYRPPIAVSRRCKFTFCQSTRAVSIRRTVISLVDMLLNELG